MTVVDASALLEVLLRSRGSGPIRGRLFAAGVSLYAPHLLDLEVVQVVRKMLLSKQVSGDLATEAVQTFKDIPIRRYPHFPLLSKIWELRDSLSAYDAAYVALAISLNGTLVTHDARLANAARHLARIELV